MTYEIVEGWTGPLDIRLKSAGADPSGDMVGMSAALLLTNKAGDVVDTAGDVTIEDVDVWVVRYAPDPSDLQPGVYRMRIKVTDSAGKVVYFPSGDPDVLVVRPETY
jgi:hypothetical protein